MLSSSFVTGFLVCAGLIVAIGAQNAFVLRQGLRREHVGAVVAFCSLSDLLLIAAGVAGLALYRPGLWGALADSVIALIMFVLATRLCQQALQG